MTVNDKRIGDGMARGVSARMGKLTEEVRAKLDIETREELRSVASELGLSESEFVRELIMVRLYGRRHVERVLRERMYVIAGLEPEESA